MKKRPPLCLEHVAWLIRKQIPEDIAFLKALYRDSPEMEALGQTARGFFEMIRNRDAAAWSQWLEAAAHSPLHRSRAGSNGIVLPSTLRSGFHRATAWWKDRYTG
ncbi:hypothetical protein [Terriglobus roseus]|uniref:hypothetical protein n=1 Tax=Terriglobus roseus TaxID=392734 RepID=UPI00145D46AD|nr:hypothetical protein [Terriglobus roseus]